jgi:hypothetical protein
LTIEYIFHNCEVFGLFADFIPAQAVNARGESLEWVRERQGLVPDFQIRLTTPEGLTDNLAELKFIGVGVMEPIFTFCTFLLFNWSSPQVSAFEAGQVTCCVIGDK